uniref:Uncharacterized protein n=1 Tax=Craspedostauros australis TaxID=1486917 RepID=A0A6T6H2J2_9STRA|mmetsp:Transcript_3655/g.9701  ORF Transcript_3655/g.9701 Transcript_3655/m.9701 type:complete len:301 (+) Transcript_3655:300-1202(+)
MTDAAERIKADQPRPFLKDPSFDNQTIVITGAGGQFGREGCQYFYRQGCNVVALDNNTKALEETKASIDDGNNDARFISITCDVTSEESVDGAIQQAVDKFPSGIHFLWNNAGYQGQIAPTLDYPVDDFRRVLDINVTGMFMVLQRVARQMTKQQAQQGQQGQQSSYAIVNTASVAGLRGTPAMIAYASSKAAVLAMTVSSSKDLAPHGIRVNAISPALIGPGYMWDRQNELHADCASPYFANDAATVARNKISGVPMKRLGSIAEVVQSVSYLLSPLQSSYTTGTNVVVDGGMSSGLKC